MKNKDVDINPPPSLDVITSMRDRQCVRAFLDKEVPNDILIKIFDHARFAPSGVNTQPWKIAVLGSTHRHNLSQAILNARNKDIAPNPDYDYYPKTWHEPFKSRRKACGLALYGALEIQKDEIEKRKKQWDRNYSFFGAPIGLIFYIDSQLCKGSWMDMGMFLQNIMLAARYYGLETCPQASLAEYPDIVREHLNISTQYHIVCGMAVGYADWSHPVNQYRTTREEINTFTEWYD